jgi:hypothetical protein
VAGGLDYEVRYETRKTGKSKAAVKKAVKKVGTRPKFRSSGDRTGGGSGRQRTL